MQNNKYPENYFEHYIVSFSSTRLTPNKAGFEDLAKSYMDIEGMDEFSNLIAEIKTIKENNDWSHFERIAQDFEIEGLDPANLKEMAELAIHTYHDISGNL